ncbi:MAG: NAD-dependent epimerase/dehydratase family protein [Dactylosporangium sp.]|nr:NAD-dependent epimerase/dehydratase family protein [Dactylosporangium sp.]NNJ62977.1 NAD-dependent epimerase/dehydratase family protein [Dactylosporangium sp.]
MRIVVTGAAGMLGSHLVRRLADRGHAVHGVDLRQPDEPVAGVEQTIGDVRDVTLLTRAAAGADAMVHCAAALPSYPADQIRSISVDGTRSALTAARTADLSRVVHISSTAVYGLPTVVPTREDYPKQPVDTYSAAKAAAEEVVAEFRTGGMCVPVLRPKTFLGPGRMGLFAMLFEWAEEGRNFPVLGRGDVRIQMLDLTDLLSAIEVVLDAPAERANDAFNVAAAEFATLREDFQAVLDAAGHGKRVVSVPARPAVAMLRGLGRLGLSPVYDRLIHKLLDDSFVSIERVRDRLGFVPEHSNRDAILRTYEWWRASRRQQPARSGGRTSRDPWRQGALAAAKVFF